MTRSASKAAPKKAAKLDLFPNMRCHHRDAAGKPDCAKKRAKASVNLCPTHQAAWAKAARERAQAAKAAAPKPNAKVVALPRRKAAPAPEREPVARAAMLAVEPSITTVDGRSPARGRPDGAIRRAVALFAP